MEGNVFQGPGQGSTTCDYRAAGTLSVLGVVACPSMSSPGEQDWWQTPWVKGLSVCSEMFEKFQGVG